MRLLRILTARNVFSPMLPREKLITQTSKSSLASYSSTVNQSEIDQHSKLGNVWWDPSGQLRGLHAMNHLRVQLLVDGLANVGIKSEKTAATLDGFKIMDIGCGGGILSEPLARAGADVTGIDASEELIKLAKNHASTDSRIANKINYIKTSIEEFTPTNEATFDAVIASEVLEHVGNTKLFVENCVRALKPGGSIFITTINRTFVSWLAGIIIAENLLGIVPKGTHDWHKFLTPEETQRLLQGCDCRTKLIHGMMYNPATNMWSWSKSTQINYALHAVKSTKQL